MWPGSVKIPVDRVAGPMDEVVAVPRRTDDAPRHIVERGAGDRLVPVPTLCQRLDRGIAGSPHAIPYRADFRVGLLARERHPGLVRKHRSFRDARSEEHTSELQSRVDLVCRLL